MKQSIFAILVGVSALLIQSCEGDENLPSDAQANFEMKAVTSQSQVSNGRVATTGYVFTEVFIGVTEIEFETLEEENEEAENGGESDDEEVEFEGEFIVDLLRGTSNPDFGLSELLAGVYQEIEIEFDNILEGENTLIAKFYFVPEGSVDTTFVEFSTAEELELEIENENGFILDGGAINSILVTVDLDILFNGIDFSALEVSEDGVIRINESSNQDLMETIVEKLEQALEAEEEDDDEDEDDD